MVRTFVRVGFVVSKKDERALFESFVGQKHLDRYVGNQIFDALDVVAVPRQQDKAHQIAQCVHQE